MNAITTIMAAQASMQHHIIRQVEGAKSMAFADMEPFDGRFEDYRWMAVQTLPSREFAAWRAMRHLRFAALVPKVQKMRRYSRHTDKRIAVDFPLMPGYVLVGVPAGRHWVEVHRCSLIRSVVGRMDNGQKMPLPLLINPLRKLINEYGDGSHALVMAPANEPGAYFSVVDSSSVDGDVIGLDDVGKPLKIRAGWAAGSIVDLAGIEGEVATVLMPLLGHVTEVRMPIDNLSKAIHS